MKKILFDCGSRDPLVAPGLLVLRLGVGLMMLIGHGLPKLRTFAEKKDAFYVPDFLPLSLMSPPVSLMAIIVAEVLFSAFLVLGLMTRLSAFVLGFAMVVAAFGRHATDPFFFAGGPAKELALMYLLIYLVLLLAGSGKWSLDSVIQKEGKRRRW
jgi:putative oxidoreductase